MLTTTPLANPELLFAYASKKERLFEADCLCIRAAFAEAAQLTSVCKLFINVTPRALTTPGFADTLTEMAADAEVSQDRIVFELTEQQTILNPQAFAETLKTLRDRGFGIALDDYGVGFANLQMVQDLRPDYIKMSGYFCRDIHLDPFKQEMYDQPLKWPTFRHPDCPENIETAEELATVQTLGITMAKAIILRPSSQAA